MKRRQFSTAIGAFLTPLAGCASTGLSGGNGRSAPASETEETAGPSADTALVISERIAVEGTNVNIGAEGTAKNSASTALADCVIHVTGAVGGKAFSGIALRERLEPGAAWEWEVAFGEEADASNVDSVENLEISTQAEYAD